MAKFRGRLPRRGPLPFKYVLLLTIVFFTISTIAGLWIINKGLKPTLMSYAESQTRQIASLIINEALLERSVVDINDVITKDTETSLTNFDTAKIYSMLRDTTRLILNNIKKAEDGDLEELQRISEFEFEQVETSNGKGIVYYVPLGQATNNALLGNLGPRIPVQFTAIGDMESNIETEFKEVGINNVYIEVLIRLKVNVQVIIPFATEVATLEQRIPIALGILEGDVPLYYNNGGQGALPAIELPVDE
ncbi:sporulation protein YunB [Robertmurraya sp. DFI.2.37]|uniref:sporulation protein YunB n=1 Tax=Robertmurraya sp. DFI.2.37 TaxID=3031819 RepID=UPI00124881A7|nr:sporulation protein YunB [Robertmurraya sp. DFI.2.37]MDF1511016.1 sporulation protein YunB [Robertmurraya sp. DFI.2.37]